MQTPSCRWWGQRFFLINYERVNLLSLVIIIRTWVIVFRIVQTIFLHVIWTRIWICVTTGVIGIGCGIQGVLVEWFFATKRIHIIGYDVWGFRVENLMLVTLFLWLARVWIFIADWLICWWSCNVIGWMFFNHLLSNVNYIHICCT